MDRPIECLFCGTHLDPAQEFTFWVELQNEDDPTYLEVIRRLPDAGGRPLVICRKCQAGVEANDRHLAADGERDERIDRRIRPVMFGCLAVAVSFPCLVGVLQVMVDSFAD